MTTTPKRRSAIHGLIAAVGLTAMLTACGNDDKPEPAASVTTSAPSAETASYCRLMERTETAYHRDDAYTVAGLRALVDAETQRIASAPSELADEYALFDGADGIPNAAIERIQDWVQQYCGFLPTFDVTP